MLSISNKTNIVYCSELTLTLLVTAITTTLSSSFITQGQTIESREIYLQNSQHFKNEEFVSKRAKALC